ncbi:MAG: pteridine-dependent deoxygenase [Gammaproteobacteria bacterium]|nr:pteridine-dependent deoxygenase [Gammaproteobacteria bacterium]
MNVEHGLRVSYEHGSVDQWLQDSTVLAVFSFGNSPLSASEARHVPIALRQLDTDEVLEVWRVDGPVRSGNWEQLAWARSDSMTMGHLALDVHECGSMLQASRQAYEIVQDFLRQSPHHCPMKIWNYIPGINEGKGDAECYREFCVGRAEAWASDLSEQPAMPAATAIGAPADESALQVYFLATALPGTNVENPRQVNAWHYPRQYGPRSPLFSRGTLMQVNGDRHFLISGTASVVGHETHHDNTADQVHESIRNVRSLLVEARRLQGSEHPVLGDAGMLRVYVRDPEEYRQVRRVLETLIPNEVQRVYLQGDICRVDLLTEVDGIVACN